MNKYDVKTLTGVVIDETHEITVTELCEVCSVEHALVESLVQEGILDPVGGQPDELRFHYTSVYRTRTVVHLQKDLGVNLAGAALALELLERIENLQRQLRGVGSS
jgi:chaperone modulatory protein CbpM